jgi:septum site-determining protein MinC
MTRIRARAPPCPIHPRKTAHERKTPLAVRAEGHASLAPGMMVARPKETLELPQLRLRGRSFMALVLAPEFPMATWFAALDRQIQQSASFFAERPVVIDLSTAVKGGGPSAAPIVLDGLAARDLRIVGVEGVEPALLAATAWERLAKDLPGRELALEARPAEADEAPMAAVSPSLLIDQPVRSGQSVVFEDGDVTIVGHVASGAEVIAGGSVHIYGALRGRAIAGLRTGEAARIFCRKLEAEMVGVDRLYRTAEHWGSTLQGRAAQVLSDRGILRLSALD